MPWCNLFMLLAVVYGAALPAASLDAVIDQANHLLATGQPGAALEQCREAQVEYPNSAALLFAIASAEAAVAEERLREHAGEEAGVQFRSARETFTRAAAKNPARFGPAATYNAATCLVHLDATFDPASAYDERVENLRRAVAAFEACLEAYPDHEKARKNLDHARYQLNLLLQDPPDPGAGEDQSGDEGGGVAELQSATTEIPEATAEVIDGRTVVLRRPAGGAEEARE